MGGECHSTHVQTMQFVLFGALQSVRLLMLYNERCGGFTHMSHTTQNKTNAVMFELKSVDPHPTFCKLLIMFLNLMSGVVGDACCTHIQTPTDTETTNEIWWRVVG